MMEVAPMNKIFRKSDCVVIMNMETAQRLIITDEDDMLKSDEELLKKFDVSINKSINSRV